MTIQQSLDVLSCCLCQAEVCAIISHQAVCFDDICLKNGDNQLWLFFGVSSLIWSNPVYQNRRDRVGNGGQGKYFYNLVTIKVNLSN